MPASLSGCRRRAPPRALSSARATAHRHAAGQCAGGPDSGLDHEHHEHQVATPIKTDDGEITEVCPRSTGRPILPRRHPEPAPGQRPRPARPTIRPTDPAPARTLAARATVERPMGQHLQQPASTSRRLTTTHPGHKATTRKHQWKSCTDQQHPRARDQPAHPQDQLQPGQDQSPGPSTDRGLAANRTPQGRGASACCRTSADAPSAAASRGLDERRTCVACARRAKDRSASAGRIASM